jgi:Flp pilus assembly protein TadG
VKKISEVIAGFKNDEDGVTSLEMVVSTTLFLIIFAWMIETGFVLMRWVMLEHGMATAARDIRINGIPATELTNEDKHNYIKEKICSQVGIIENCNSSLFLELTPVNPTTGVPTTAASCVDRTGPVDPLTDLPPVIDGERSAADLRFVMYMRACVVVDTILPTSLAMPFAYDNSGGLALVSENAYINEPS